MSELEFIKTVMKIFSDYDCTDDLSWEFIETGEIRFTLWMNDWFFYASSYVVEIHEDDIDLLKKSFEDAEKANKVVGCCWATKLFACRNEKLNPLKEYISDGKYKISEGVIELFKCNFEEL